MSQFVCGQRSAEKIALSFGTMTVLEEGKLCLRFDTLGNDALLELPAHVDDCAHDGRIIRLGGDLIDKRPVNLQDINGEPAKITQTGIAGAEVIHGQVYAYGFEGRKYGGHTFDKTLIAKFDGRHINGYAFEWEAGALPFARLSACFTQHPAANREDEAGGFGDGHKLGGRNQSAIRMLPADQGLYARDLTGDEIYFGLIMRQELIALQWRGADCFQAIAATQILGSFP
jgi:hypothetical protein